jgi:hypothetical protein
MKILKYIGAVFFLLLGIGQAVPIYLISSGLLQGQGGEDSAYFVGKLVGHLVGAVLVLALASLLYKSAGRQGGGGESRV